MKFSQWGYGHVVQTQPHAPAHCWNATQHTVSHAYAHRHTNTHTCTYMHMRTDFKPYMWPKYVRNLHLSRHVHVGAVGVASCYSVQCCLCAGYFWMITCTTNILRLCQTKFTPVSDMIYLYRDVIVLLSSPSPFPLCDLSYVASLPSLLLFLTLSIPVYTQRPGSQECPGHREQRHEDR